MSFCDNEIRIPVVYCNIGFVVINTKSRSYKF